MVSDTAPRVQTMLIRLQVSNSSSSTTVKAGLHTRPEPGADREQQNQRVGHIRSSGLGEWVRHPSNRVVPIEMQGVMNRAATPVGTSGVGDVRPAGRVQRV